MSAIIHSVTAEHSGQRLGGFLTLFLSIQTQRTSGMLLKISPVHMQHRCTDSNSSLCSVTCVSTGDVVFPVFLMENNFHHRRQRNVATRHTLPNIQISLSLRKSSMVDVFPFPCLPVVCLISASLPPVAKESQVVGNNLLTWGETAGVDYGVE